MNIYLVSQDDNNGYDTYDAMVVCAASEDEARNLNPQGAEGWAWDSGSWCSKPEKATVELIGTTSKYEEAQIILSSFHAG